jgi:4a-hydroxytetrahydrobiopterin dehydratase
MGTHITVREKTMDWKVQMDEHIHTGEEIALRLQNELQYWYIKNGCIQRKYCTSGWNETLLVIDTVAQLAKATLHDPDLTASGAFVIVKLKTHSAKGVTNKDFELARKIEKAVIAYPGDQGGVPDIAPAPGELRFGASNGQRATLSAIS